jgi:hypothetical protein
MSKYCSERSRETTRNFKNYFNCFIHVLFTIIHYDFYDYEREALEEAQCTGRGENIFHRVTITASHEFISLEVSFV